MARRFQDKLAGSRIFHPHHIPVQARIACRRPAIMSCGRRTGISRVTCPIQAAKLGLRHSGHDGYRQGVLAGTPTARWSCSSRKYSQVAQVRHLNNLHGLDALLMQANGLQAPLEQLLEDWVS